MCHAVEVYERQMLCLFSYNVIENSIIYIHEQYPTKKRSERYLYEKEVPCMKIFTFNFVYEI